MLNKALIEWFDGRALPVGRQKINKWMITDDLTMMVKRSIYDVKKGNPKGMAHLLIVKKWLEALEPQQ